METILSLRPLLAVAISLVATVFIVLSYHRPNVREAWTLAAAVVKFFLVFSMLPDVLAGRVPEVTLPPLAPGIALVLRADPFGLFFALVASALWIFTSIYSIGYVRGLSEHKQTRYFASFAVALSSTIGVAFAANLLTFIVFYEMLTIATYPLVVHKETPEAISAGRKYLAYTLSAGVALIFAAAWTYHLTGTLEFQAGGFLAGSASPGELLALLALFVFGCGVKAGIMPLHSWLPTAMVAPTPVSGLLHAVAVVKAGVFGMLRIVGFVFGPALLEELGAWYALAIIAGATLLLASLLAFRQDNLKRRLAYSTIGHLSYIILGAALLTPHGWLGGVLHLVNHATLKITLFFCAGAIYVKTHRENVSELDGIGRQMPLTMGAFALASLGLAGVPPMNGFVSKWFLGMGALEAQQTVFLLLLLLSGLLNAGYLLPIVRRAFFERSADFARFDEPSMLMVIPLVITALLSLAMGFLPDGFGSFYHLATEIATSVVTGGSN